MSIFKNPELVEENEEVVKVVKKIRRIDSEAEKKAKKRKEPQKPWGRRERVLVLALLVLTSGASFILALSAREWKLPGLPRLTLPSLGIFKESTIVIEGDKSYKEELEKSKIVENAFYDLTNNQSGVYGLYFYDLTSDFSFGINESETFEAASLIKLPVLASLYKEAEKGDISLDQEYRLKETDKIGGAGSLYFQKEGYVVTFRQMAELMGKQSD